MVREGSFRWDDFYIHQSQNASIITAKDRKTLSPVASKLHWMQMISDNPIGGSQCSPALLHPIHGLEEFWQLFLTGLRTVAG
jgi:hypothetical protein